MKKRKYAKFHKIPKVWEESPFRYEHILGELSGRQWLFYAHVRLSKKLSPQSENKKLQEIQLVKNRGFA